MLVELDTYKVPEWALPAIINGDTSGLSAEDEQLIAQWEAQLSADAIVYDILDDEPHFTTRPAFGLACNCYNVRVYHYVMEANQVLKERQQAQIAYGNAMHEHFRD